MHLPRVPPPLLVGEPLTSRNYPSGSRFHRSMHGPQSGSLLAFRLPHSQCWSPFLPSSGLTVDGSSWFLPSGNVSREKT